MTGDNASKRSSIDTHLAFNFESFGDEVQNSFTISFNIVRIWSSFVCTIPSVIPDYNIAPLIHKVLQPKVVWIVHHLLVTQSVRVAQNHRWPVVVLTAALYRVCLFRVEADGHVDSVLRYDFSVNYHVLGLRWKEHQRHFVAVIRWSFELDCVVVVSQNVLKLFKVTKHCFAKSTVLLQNLCCAQRYERVDFITGLLDCGHVVVTSNILWKDGCKA
mmetsp:Transcript_23462/g.23422  ORF Transcript_23462/g.23422 Transcript_23462/m.23422 type:complete len:216 (-) Transcript_23462:679-1326(-)